MTGHDNIVTSVIKAENNDISTEEAQVDYCYLEDAGFSEEILFAIDSLSRRPDEDYDSYIHRVSKNQLATKVKIIDLHDNIWMPFRRETLRRRLTFANAIRLA